MPLALAVLVVLIIILFVVGISFVYSGGWNASPSVNPVELQKKEEDLALAKSAQVQVSTELSSVKQELEQTQATLEQAKKLEETVAVLQDKEAAKEQEVEQLNAKVQAIYMKADTQAKDALEIIETLKTEGRELRQKLEELQASSVPPNQLEQASAENAKLKTQVDELQTKLNQAQDEFTKIKAERDQEISKANQAAEDPAKVQALEEQLAQIRREQEQKLTEANETIENLKAENQALSVQLQEAGDTAGLKRDFTAAQQSGEEAGAQAAAVIENLKIENTELQKQVEESMAKMQNLKEEILRLKSGDSAQSPAGSSAPASPQEAEELKALCDDFRRQLEQMKSAVTSLREDGAGKGGDSQAEFSDLHERLNKMKELNKFLIEKEKLMQLELTKSRVQALGLAKICEDFKSQVDKMSRK